MKYASLTTLMIVLAVPSLAQAKNNHHESDMVRIDNASPPATTYALMRDASSNDDAIDVYLNPHGARISGGRESSARLSSGLVARRGVRSTVIPRYRGTRSSWNAVVQCVRRRYANFNVNIHSQRPSGRYIMAMVGGSASQLNYSGRIGGVAPYNGRIIDNAIVFVFDRNWRRTASLCNTVVHEVGHALGLEHMYLCKDPMSYLRGCGTKTFQNVEAWCGEYRARRCHNGGMRNTVQHLTKVVGLRDSDPDPDPDTDPDPDSDPQPDPQPPVTRPRGDRTPPTVTIVSPRRVNAFDANTTIQIVVQAVDRGGIANVQLGWTTQHQQMVFNCARIPRNMPVTCTKKNNRYVFTLRVGIGDRAFAVRVTDRAGNSTTTTRRSLYFGDDEDDEDYDEDS